MKGNKMTTTEVAERPEIDINEVKFEKLKPICLRCEKPEIILQKVVRDEKGIDHPTNMKISVCNTIGCSMYIDISKRIGHWRVNK